MKRTKRLLSMLLTLVMVTALFAACGGSEAPSTADETTAAPEATTQAEQADAGAGEEMAADDDAITLKLWHIWTNDIDPQRMVIEEAVAEVEKAYPNIKFEITANEDEDNKTKLPLALASDEGPDIFYWQGAGNGAEIVGAGNVLDLTPYYEGDADLMTALPKGALEYTSYDGKVYGYPYAANAAFLYCNTEIFEANNVKIPETYDELLEAAKTFSAAGIVPMSVAGAELWPIMFQIGALSTSAAGAQATNDALAGRGSFNTPELLQAATQLQELAINGFYSPSIMSVGYEEAQNAFTNGESAMFFMGDWAAGALSSSADVAVAGKVAFEVWPDAGNGYGNDRFGGSANALWVNSKTEYPDEAAAALAMLAEQMSKIGYSKGTLMPIWTTATEGNGDPELARRAELLSVAEGYNLWWDTALGTEKGGKLNEYCASLLNGEITPEQFVAALDALVAQ